MGNLMKAQNIVPINNKAADDLKAFIFAEARDHASRLHECMTSGADDISVDYHYEKIVEMLDKLEGKQ